jgi:hypothetical protein
VSTVAAAQTLSVLPGTKIVVVGQEFTVSINLDYMTNLVGFELPLTFDKTRLNATALDYTGYLGTGGDAYVIAEINNTGGYVDLSVARTVSPPSGVTGGGNLAVVHFKCLSAGTSTLHLNNTILAVYPSGAPVAHSRIDGTVMSAPGTVTYNAASNIVAVTGGTLGSPVGFLDLWNADKAGTLTLQSRTGIGGTDASPVAFTTNLRPTDYYVLGGAKRNLYITVSSWTSITSSTIQISGTDTAGNVQTEDIVVTASGTYFPALYYHTCTSSKVTAWTGTGSYAYNVTQTQWGIVWKTGASEFAFDAKLYIGDGVTATYFADKDKMVVFNTGIATASYQNIFFGAAGSTITLGQLDDATAKSTSHGCVIQMLEASYYNSQFWGAGTLCLYSCTLMGYWNGAILGQPILYGFTATSKAYNCLFVCFTLQTALPGSEVNNLIVTGGKYAITACRGTMNDIRCYMQDYALYVTTNYATAISNVVLRDATIYSIYSNAITTDKYLVNVDADTWTIQWVGTCTAKIYRQYTFDLKVTDKNNNNLSGANVTLKDKNNNTVFSVLTDASGNIATQTVSRGFYNQTYLSTLQDLSPHTLTITKTSYTTFTQKFTLTGKTTWQMSLSP